ncbi:hypothetical protein [Salinimicrobium xinjiangense]|uniref:hypothetical protein n=1 Tax=Salinimicrobium xinjiangense TaxID=438596 RepID=UPI0004143522|nr:hypothetical protein [Salinimicrobium xinjiangense]
MLTDRINLQKKLENLRKKEMKQEALLEEVREILRKAGSQQEVLHRINREDPEEIHNNAFNFDLLESGRIYHISQIKKICIQYRLRFLSTKYFKGEIPGEALEAVSSTEKQHDIVLNGFTILAPAKYFRLENADDPMLFAPIGNNYYYLLHKWGTDIHPLRKIAMWPLRNLENLIIFSFFASFFLTFGIREVFFSQFQETSQFLILFMYTFKSLIALIFFYGISLGKNFSSGNWNSKFYNA